MNFFKRAYKLTVYSILFFWELIKANFQIVVLVLSPGFKFKSAAVIYKTNVKTSKELILLSNSITLTPGTLVMDASLKKGEILVHVMSTESSESIKKSIHDKLEKRVIWALR